MKGIRMIGSLASSPMYRTDGVSHRLLGAARFSSMKSPFQPDQKEQRSVSQVNISDLKRFRSYSKHTGSNGLGEKGSGFWWSLAAGLLGVGGASLFYNVSNKGFFNKSLLVTAHCAGGCDNECVEKTCDSSDCLRKTDREEELIAKANSELEKALKDTKPKAVEYTEAALKAYCDASAAIKLFMNKTYCAVEEENLESPRFEEVWCDVYDALKKRCELAKIAMEKGQCAWELLRRLREIIENGKACKYTSCNPLLVTAEETMMCAEKELCNKKQMMDILLKESRVVEQYRNMVEEFRRDLKAEADSLVPSEECKVTLTENEANMIFTHAYKKILRVQKEMNKNGNSC